MSLAAAGADGLIVEVHHNPQEALSDKAQALLPAAFEAMVRRVRAVRPCIESLP